MGSLFKPKVETPAVPQQNAVDNFVNSRDEINRTESVKVQQPDGTWTVVTRRLPLTAEQQAEEDNLKRIAQENLARFEELSTNFDVDQIEGLRDYVDAFTTTNRQILGQSFKTASETSAKSLARSGLDDSTAAVQERARNNKSYVQGLEQIGRDAEQIKQGVRSQEQQNALSLYSLATGRQDALLNSLTGAAANNLQSGLSLANMNMQGQWNRYNAELDAANKRNQASQQGLSNVLSLASIMASNAARAGYSGGF